MVTKINKINKQKSVNQRRRSQHSWNQRFEHNSIIERGPERIVATGSCAETMQAKYLNQTLILNAVPTPIVTPRPMGVKNNKLKQKNKTNRTNFILYQYNFFLIRNIILLNQAPQFGIVMLKSQLKTIRHLAHASHLHKSTTNTLFLCLTPFLQLSMHVNTSYFLI